MIPFTLLRWHPPTPLPTRRGIYLLRLADGDYTAESYHAIGASWITLREVTAWARLR